MIALVMVSIPTNYFADILWSLRDECFRAAPNGVSPRIRSLPNRLVVCSCHMACGLWSRYGFRRKTDAVQLRVWVRLPIMGLCLIAYAMWRWLGT